MASRVPLAEAAAALGLSVVAARRRAQRGSLPAEKVGDQWYVTLPAAAHRPVRLADQDGTSPDHVDSTGSTDVTADSTAVHALERLLREERQRASSAEQAAAMWQERAAHLTAENERLQEQLALPVHEVPAEAERPAETKRAPWWRRLFAPAG